MNAEEFMRDHANKASSGRVPEILGDLTPDAMQQVMPLMAEGPNPATGNSVSAVGTEGVLTIDDTHRDIVLATNLIQAEGYAPDKRRHVDFLTSYPVGDMALGELRGPMREETNSWLNRVALGVTTQHATAREGHNRLMLTKAIDLSARLKRPVRLPITPQDMNQAG